MGASFSGVEKRVPAVVVDTPVAFYDACHRQVHFQSFAELEDVGVDRSDNFA